MSKAMISERLVAARKRLGWTRESLAYHSGVSWSAIAQLEAGRRTSPRPETLLALARALGVSIGYLVGEHPPTTLLAHRAVLYRSAEEFVDAVVPFVQEGVERSEPVNLVTTAANLELMERELGGWPPGVSVGESEAWYRSPLEMVAALRAFLDDRIEEGAPWIRSIGEPTWHPPHIGLWAAFESLFNLLFSSAPLTAMCPYDERALDSSILDVARRTHPSLVRGGSVEPSESFIHPEMHVLGGEGAAPDPGSAT